MYQEHNVFRPPEDVSTLIWRYMDFTKFAHLLESQTLHFTRSDCMGDPFEGALTKTDLELLRDAYERRKSSLAAYKGPLSLEVRSTTELWQNLRRQVGLNCWHINNHESAAMWKIYLKSDEGIAIRSTYSRLVGALAEDPDHLVFVGRTFYIDYNNEVMPSGNVFYPFTYKRMSFEHEHELRAVAVRADQSEDGGIFMTGEELGRDGVNIPVDLPTLLESVYVSPTSVPWFKQLVETLMSRMGHSDVTVQRSDLADGPLW